jgi:hypothetical protein
MDTNENEENANARMVCTMKERSFLGEEGGEEERRVIARKEEGEKNKKGVQRGGDE